jgi:outer membrane protein OmpA-like peptidoglycan-associated protein
LDIGLQYYVLPDTADSLAPDMAKRYGVSGGLIKPYPGFRAGAGYEWRNWRFSLESGYTYVKGDNPLVLDIHFIPLTFKAGYAFSPWKNLSIVPALGAGLTFVSVNHYETAIDMLLDNQSHSSNRGFLLNAGIRLGWSFTPALEFFAGAGLDCIVESGGLISLPAVELGITIKPFRFGKKKEAAGEEAPGKAIPAMVKTPEAVVPEAIEKAAEIPALPPESKVRIVRVLYFPEESAVPAGSRLVELDAAAELLLSSPELGVTLRGYAAPYGTVTKLYALSEGRARFCADYLEKKYGIESRRITVEWHGADKEPEASDGEDWRRRCVEIIIETMAKP